MNIQWYPGHMTKAVREMESNLKKVDAVIYLLDARAVNACINPKLDRLAEGKPVLYLINKRIRWKNRPASCGLKNLQARARNVLPRTARRGETATRLRPRS